MATNFHRKPIMKIQSLLNPFCSDPGNGYSSSESPAPAAMPRIIAPYGGLPKRTKIPKDAPIFSEGTKTVGFINYPPYEAHNNQELAAQHRKFQIFPMGEIVKKGVRHIPYNSDKKDFMEKTGRDAFEMFQYTYKVPGEDKEYVVVWDYNVGLVRMTPFFKSLKYSKTIPAKALRENPGLKDISYSITGGALVCQGYWMPYQAAKAVAATFCYNIRWALTPVFGNDFPSLCIPPKDPSFAKFLIDPEIVRLCTRETNRFRIEGESYKILSSVRMHTPPTTTILSGAGEVANPAAKHKHQFATPPWSPQEMTNQVNTAAHILYPASEKRPRTSEESSFGTESDFSDKYLFSPQISPRSTTWTSINRSQSPVSPRGFHSPQFSSPTQRFLPPPLLSSRVQRVLPTSVPGGYYDEPTRTKRTHSKMVFEEGDMGVLPSEKMRQSGDGVHTRKEMDAAEIILQLSAMDHTLPPSKRTRRGSME